MRLNSVNLNNYSGLWCIEPMHFRQLVDRVNSMDLASHVSAQGIQEYDATVKAFDVADGGGVAVIDIQGTMTKSGSSLGSGGMVQARRAIRQADQDSAITSIVLRVDSPGGTVSGTADLAAEVARTSKPIVAFAEDLCASAAMWVASQCDSVYANSATAKIGSIGTFMGLYDISSALEGEGVKAVVVKAGEFKGGGFPGMEVSEGQIAEWQKVIDATQAEFTKGIATGRGMPIKQAERLVTGLVYIAADAQELNLIDGIKTFDEVVEELRSQTSTKGTVAMSEQTNPQPATFKEIVAACPGIDAKNAADAVFISECQGAELVTADVSAQWCQTLQDRATAAVEQSTALSAEMAELKASGKRPGVPAIETSSSSGAAGDPAMEWDAAIAAEVAKGKSRADAAIAVNRRNPELRKALIDAAN